MSWVAESHPWGTWVWWPALSFLALEAVAVAAALVIAARRDLGSGVLPQRLGRGTASAALGTPAGLAWRLTRGATFGWTAVAVIWCTSIGLMADEMARIIQDNPTLAAALGDDPSQVVSVMSLVITGIVAGAAGVAAISRFGARGAGGADRAGAGRGRIAGADVAGLERHRCHDALAALFSGALALGWRPSGCREAPARRLGRELRAAGAYGASRAGHRGRGAAWLP